MRRLHRLAPGAAMVLAVGLPGTVLGGSFSQKVAGDGRVHRVETEMPTRGFSALRHVLQLGDGTSMSAIIPGTDDAAVDRDPALAMDPATGAPVLAWARNAGAGWDVMISRFEADSWTPARMVFGDTGDETRPQIRVAGRLVHVITRRELAGKSTFVRRSFDRVTLAPAYGPEILPTEGGVPLSLSEGTIDSAGYPAPPPGDVFFASDLIRLAPGDQGHIVVWGIRDEPMPIDYLQLTFAPTTLKECEQPGAGWVGDSFVLSFAAGSRFYYAYHRQGTWSELRGIELSDKVTKSDARLQVEELLRSLDAEPDAVN